MTALGYLFLVATAFALEDAVADWIIDRLPDIP